MSGGSGSYFIFKCFLCINWYTQRKVMKVKTSTIVISGKYEIASLPVADPGFPR